MASRCASSGSSACPRPASCSASHTTPAAGWPLAAAPAPCSTTSPSTDSVTEVIGVSSESWAAAARNAVETAAKTVRDLRVAEVIRQDVTIENGSLVNYRVRLGISFKYESGD